MQKFKIPKEVSQITEALQKEKYETYLVGGCVRDLMLNREPNDWDITTNANPEQIQSLFDHTYYENTYGTVGIVNDETEKLSLKNIEVTPYRLESKYSDARHPDKVEFSKNIEDDLKRRDFTMNAIAYNPTSDEIIDLYKGQEDIKNKIIRTVGDAEKRFQEDALRILRAVRFETQLDFEIEKETKTALVNSANALEKIAKERIKDEFVKIIMSDNPMKGLQSAHDLKILKYIIPELEEGIGSDQKGAHIYTIWEHNLRALQHSADKNYPLHIRLGALLHDVGKPASKRFDKIKKENTFYGHEVVGARMAKKIMERLKFPKDISETVVKLVRNHLFFSDIDLITLSAVRRLIVSVGKENVWDLMSVRHCDRIGMGRPEENPYRLRKYKSMIEEAMKDPVSVGMLKVDGVSLMKLLNEKPGPKIGYILHALLEEVLDDPKLNTKKYLEKKSIELNKVPINELKKLGEAGKEKKDSEEAREVEEIRKKYSVK